MDSEFQSTLPARGATRISAGLLSSAQNFNPRSPHGERLATYWETLKESTFQSTLPARGATTQLFLASCVDFISIHAPRTGSDTQLFLASCVDFISIHAPRTGSDVNDSAAFYIVADFNPRSPHGERRQDCSCRRMGGVHFNPRSPHGERLRTRFPFSLPLYFNPRSPHGERLIPPSPLISLSVFQSTLPARGATLSQTPLGALKPTISIHAPRTGSDGQGACAL